jgi:hypothetical protein
LIDELECGRLGCPHSFPTNIAAPTTPWFLAQRAWSMNTFGTNARSRLSLFPERTTKPRCLRFVGVTTKRGEETMKQFPIYIAAIAAVAVIGAPASQAADAQSGIIVAQATSPGDPAHPGSQPSFMPKEQSSAQQQPAQPAAQAPQQGGQPTAQSQQRRQSAAPTAARRTQPATTGSGSQQR